MLGKINVSLDQPSNLVTITARDSKAQRAADIANAFANAIGTTRARRSLAEIDQTIATLNKQRAKLTSRDRADRALPDR